MATVHRGYLGTIIVSPGVGGVREIICSESCGQDVILSHRVDPEPNVLELPSPHGECGNCLAPLDHRFIFQGGRP